MEQPQYSFMIVHVFACDVQIRLMNIMCTVPVLQEVLTVYVDLARAYLVDGLFWCVAFNLAKPKIFILYFI